MPRSIWKGTRAPEEKEAETGVLDLMAALRRSVEGEGKTRSRSRRASRPRAGTRKSA